VSELFERISHKEALGVKKLNAATRLIQNDQGGSPMETMSYIGLHGHKKTISYCVKDGGGGIYAEGSIPATRLPTKRLSGGRKQKPHRCVEGAKHRRISSARSLPGLVSPR